MSDDPYVYPGTDVLRNRFGIRDRQELSRVEAEVVRARSAELREHLEQPPFDLERLQAIHGHLFGDVYEWAGRLRTVRIDKQGVPFANPQFIEHQASLVFGALAQEHYLVDFTRMDPEENIAASITATVDADHSALRKMLVPLARPL